MTGWRSALLKHPLLQEAFSESPRSCIVLSSGLLVTALSCPTILYCLCLWHDYISTRLWASEGRDHLVHPWILSAQDLVQSRCSMVPVNLNGNELPAHILSQQARHFQGRRAGARLSCRRLWKQPLDSVCCAPNPFWKSAEILGQLRAKKGGRETCWLGRVWVGWGTRKRNQNLMLYIVFPHSLFCSSLKGNIGAKYGIFRYHHFSFSSE